VAIGSAAVGMVTPPGMGFSHYVASKMGVVGLVRALANELARDNIIVNAVHPGITDTEGASGMPDEQKAQVYMMQGSSGSVRQPTSPARSPSSPAMTRASSPARRWWSMAG
jgi:NAD(P)-dependent dehydrogenase (short-subunit alcohol dehydrogenase family)